MSKAEEFIKAKTRIGSNTTKGWRRNGVSIPSYNLPWLTPEDARKAVEIAKDEVTEKICMWLEDNISENCYGDYLEFTATSISNIDFFNQEALIRDLRKAMKDE